MRPADGGPVMDIPQERKLVTEIPGPTVTRVVRTARRGGPSRRREHPSDRDGARVGRDRRRRRREPTDRLRHRDRGAERRPRRARGGRGGPAAARARHPHVLPRDRERAVHRARGAPERARARRPREEDDVRELGRGGRRERREDRAEAHGPIRDRRVRSRVPRPDADGDVAHGEGDAVQAGHGPVRARDLPAAARLPLPLSDRRDRGDLRRVLPAPTRSTRCTSTSARRTSPRS